MHHCCWQTHTQNCVSIIFINMQPQTQLRKETHVSRANVIKRDIWTLHNAGQTCSSEESWSFVVGSPGADGTGATPWLTDLLIREGREPLIFGSSMGYRIFPLAHCTGIDFENWNRPLDSLPSFYRGENKGSEWFTNLPKVTQLASGKTM